MNKSFGHDKNLDKDATEPKKNYNNSNFMIN